MIFRFTVRIKKTNYLEVGDKFTKIKFKFLMTVGQFRQFKISDQICMS